jgi:hypothetical protein
MVLSGDIMNYGMLFISLHASGKDHLFFFHKKLL